ncbi:type II secretion system protein GspD [Limnochorda pilosa]|uniref:type II secretion system protein GspD n=1 Tax=Limnochorda pilosa TaxID=1555112 RepID=UPI001187609A|nr:secretin N-terminal domain-containing protein [Limnochorda pilosa]
MPTGESRYVEEAAVTVAAAEGSPWVTTQVHLLLTAGARQHGFVAPDGRRIQIALTPEPAVKPDEGSPPVGGFQAVSLRYADARDLASTLRRLVPYGDTVIQVDERLNRLILDSSLERFEDLRRLVEELDRPGDQILIDAQIVEIHADAASHLGISLSASISTRFREESQYYGTVPLPLQPFVRTPVEIMATLDLLKGEGKAQVLANPRVATVDGVPAVVRTEERFPVFVTQVSGDQSFRVKQDIVAGITLSITPRHNGDGEITTQIKTDVTSITGTTSEGYPTTSSREAETTIRVRSGETIVIGGLLERREIEHRDKIPLLGDIPYFGALFTNFRSEMKETELFIIVTPYLIGEV